MAADEVGADDERLREAVRLRLRGLFEPHEIETRYPQVAIPDQAFERIFDYFDQYQWHLDERPLRADNEINPDVLGYIVEKYINQKAFGAYYTRPEITGYLCERTIHRLILDAVNTPEQIIDSAKKKKDRRRKR